MPNDASGNTSWQRKAIEHQLAGLPANAPIRACVADPSVEVALQEHERLDAVAIERQGFYYFWSQFGLWSVFVAGILGSLLLANAADIDSDTKLLLGLVQAIAVGGVVLSFFLVRLRWQMRGWIETRAAAERTRCDVFQNLLGAPGPVGADDTVLARQKFDMIMKAHITDQLAFYERGCLLHSRLPGHVAVMRWAGYAIFVAAIVLAATLLPSGLAALFRLTGNQPPTWLVSAQNGFAAVQGGLDADSLQRVLSALAASLLGFTGTWSLLYQHDRHHCLYEENKRRLGHLITAEAASAAAAADLGRLDNTKTLLDKSRSIMEAEHQVWRRVVQGPH